VSQSQQDSTEAWVTDSRGGPGFVVWLLLTIGINMLALIVVDWLFDGVAIGRWWPLVIGATVLGLANGFLKPVLALLTLPVIVVTFGLAYFALNVGMLALAEWVAPDFSIDGFWTYVGATIVVWLVNVVMQSFLGAISGTKPGPRPR
jgi:putative membrane protein